MKSRQKNVSQAEHSQHQRADHHEATSQPQIPQPTVPNNISHSDGTAEFQNRTRQDKPHSSTPIHRADRRYMDTLGQKRDIVWPQMNIDEPWAMFQARVRAQLNPIGSVASRLNNLETAAYEVGSDMFGHKCHQKGFPIIKIKIK